MTFEEKIMKYFKKDMEICGVNKEGKFISAKQIASNIAKLQGEVIAEGVMKSTSVSYHDPYFPRYLSIGNYGLEKLIKYEGKQIQIILREVKK